MILKKEILKQLIATRFKYSYFVVYNKQFNYIEKINFYYNCKV